MTLVSPQHLTPRAQPPIDLATDLDCPDIVDSIKEHRYGTLQLSPNKQITLTFRRFAKRATLWHVLWAKTWTHSRKYGDTCKLYYDAPKSCPGFVIIKLMVSHRNTTYRSTRKIMAALDKLASIRETNAIVFHASNKRLTDRVVERFGYVRHAENLPGRHFIKRF